MYLTLESIRVESAAFVEELTNILVKMKVVSVAEGRALQEAFKGSSRAAFDQFLLEEGLVAEENLLKALGDLYQVLYIDVVGIFFDSALLHKFPKGMLLRLGVIPYQVDGNILILIASRPDNPNLRSCLGRYVSYDLQFMVGLRRDIESTIREFYEASLTEVDESEERDSNELSGYSEYGDEGPRDTQKRDDTFDDDDSDFSAKC